MSDCVMPRCGRPTTDGFVCSSCSDQLMTDLRSIPELIAELDLTISRQVRLGDSIGPIAQSTHDSLRTPVNWAAADAAVDLHDVLHTWAADVADRIGHQLDDHSTTALAQWLLRHVTSIRQHTAAEQLVDEITDAITRVRRLIDRPADKVFVGRCSADIGGADCDEDLYGYAHRSTVVCPKCRTEWRMDARRQWLLDAVEDEVAHSGLLSGLVSGLGVRIASSTIRGYARKGRIHQIALDRKRRPLYRVGDVLDVFLRRHH